MNTTALFTGWASNASPGGFALWTGFVLFIIGTFIVGTFYYTLIKSSDIAKSMTIALVWGLITVFMGLMILFFNIWL